MAEAVPGTQLSRSSVQREVRCLLRGVSTDFILSFGFSYLVQEADTMSLTPGEDTSRLLGKSPEQGSSPSTGVKHTFMTQTPRPVPNRTRTQM